jgi:hypothetical protein
MPDARYLLGYGERLTGRIAPPSGGPPGAPPYTREEAFARLAGRAEAASRQLDELPDAACPEGEAVAVLTLHPQSIAKSYFPARLLREFDMRHIGSRPAAVTADKWTRDGEVQELPTTDLYVAGNREDFGDLAAALSAASSRVSDDITRIESVRAPDVAERLRGTIERDDVARLEVVLHARDSFEDARIVEAFGEYADELGIDARLGKRLYAGGLCFLPVVAPSDRVAEMSQFAFLRVARPVGRMRSIAPIERSLPSPDLNPVVLPTSGPVDPDLRVAVFDGGLSQNPSLTPWVDAHEVPGLSAAVRELESHGHDVTSAVLFGSLEPGATAPQPYCHVDNFRVLDDSGSDPFELYDVLGRIQSVLEDRDYEFVNLSIGPAVPVEDDEVHAWTAVLDEHLSDGRAIVTSAVGNNGDETFPESRIQVPADSVNALCVGATDSSRSGWDRASYSALGPGRSPGVVKPDIVTFGGSPTEPFLVLDAANSPMLARTCGTSFSAPATLRQAVALRAHFGARLSPLAIRALLIHGADPVGHQRDEVGWGTPPTDLEDIAVCSDGMVRVVYQGELTPSQYVRALIPTPSTGLAGLVSVRATFCYATSVDPEDPGNYTRSGLEITFRPHSAKFAQPGAIDPASKSFFKKTDFDPEHSLRNDAQKWETVLRQEQRFRASSLQDPVFDIHYNAREAGGPARGAERMRYALVVDVSCPRVPDLYDRVSATFAGRLEALVPLVEIPVRV